MQYMLFILAFSIFLSCSSKPSEGNGGDYYNEVNLPSTNGDSYTQPSGYNLVWSDEFNSNIIDLNNWNYDTGAWGWGNNEWENYTYNGTGGNNAFVTNGVLVIKAIKTTGGLGGYTSARMKTQEKKWWRYGVIVARLILPFGKGIWPAFWMLGTNITTVNWPKCGEIDIMEMIGGSTINESTTYGTLHWGENPSNGHLYEGSSFKNNETLSGNWHYYEAEWNPSNITIRFDGNTVFSKDVSSLSNYFDHPFFIILNIAVGGNWPGYPDSTTIFPQYMFADWVRVYQK